MRLAQIPELTTRPFEVMETPDLVSALDDYTLRYTRLLSEGGIERELDNCRDTIEHLIDELRHRKKLDVPPDPSSFGNRAPT